MSGDAITIDLGVIGQRRHPHRRTRKGFSANVTRAALAEVDEIIGGFANHNGDLAALMLASYQDMRADLASQLNDIGEKP